MSDSVTDIKKVVSDLQKTVLDLDLDEMTKTSNDAETLKKIHKVSFEIMENLIKIIDVHQNTVDSFVRIADNFKKSNHG